ncbi:MAG: phosphoribosylglycinamide formyltransferase [Bacteroidetes bacterium]|nr:phosphoribosylglycinamide formyltransferase [Bacteroidota bacterium]
MKKTRLILFASGSGTNAENIIRYFEHHPWIEVCGVYCNKADAGVIQRVEPYSVPTRVFKPSELRDGVVLQELADQEIDYIVLAGFLLLIPTEFVRAFPDRIINIHPALLPKYGGKGMYGMHVHEAVVAAGETESGITIHLVNEHYDEGESLFKAHVPLEKTDTPQDVAGRIHELEYRFFPKVIERYIRFGKS